MSVKSKTLRQRGAGQCMSRGSAYRVAPGPETPLVPEGISLEVPPPPSAPSASASASRTRRMAWSPDTLSPTAEKSFSEHYKALPDDLRKSILSKLPLEDYIRIHLTMEVKRSSRRRSAPTHPEDPSRRLVEFVAGIQRMLTADTYEIARDQYRELKAVAQSIPGYKTHLERLFRVQTLQTTQTPFIYTTPQFINDYVALLQNPLIAYFFADFLTQTLTRFYSSDQEQLYTNSYTFIDHLYHSFYTGQDATVKRERLSQESRNLLEETIRITYKAYCRGVLERAAQNQVGNPLFALYNTISYYSQFQETVSGLPPILSKTLRQYYLKAPPESLQTNAYQAILHLMERLPGAEASFACRILEAIYLEMFESALCSEYPTQASAKAEIYAFVSRNLPKLSPSTAEALSKILKDKNYASIRTKAAALSRSATTLRLGPFHIQINSRPRPRSG